MEKSKQKPVSLEGEKIVTASAMAEMEREAIAKGNASGNEYMERAAEGISRRVFEYIEEEGEAENFHVVILAGKGNNGGDAYSVGEILVESNIAAIAYQFSEEKECSPLCKSHMKRFQDAGGRVYYPKSIEEVKISPDSLILDGLLGTGFSGMITGLMKEAVDKVNGLENRVISIDIASGVPGNTGKVEGSAIFADCTVYLGLLKVGHFYNDGFEHAGNLVGVDFGISKEYIEKVEPFAYLINPQILPRNLPKRKRTANKYTVGQGIIVAGSTNMPGAAILASKAALRSGIGIVRLYSRGEIALLPPEVIRHSIDIENLLQELSRTKALLVGPGLGREPEVKDLLKSIYEKVHVPVVIDGDALFFFEKINAPAVLTPHRGELCHLLQINDPVDDLELIEQATFFAKEKNVVILFKGAPTTAISPDGRKIVIPYGNRGMASAGMGDALSGIILALLAQGLDPYSAAVLGAAIHGLAGDIAKEAKSSQSMTASDLIESLPQLFLHQ